MTWTTKRKRTLRLFSVLAHRLKNDLLQELKYSPGQKFTYTHSGQGYHGNIGFSVIYLNYSFSCDDWLYDINFIKKKEIWCTSFLFNLGFWMLHKGKCTYRVKTIHTAQLIFGYVSLEQMFLVAINKILAKFWLDIWPLFLTERLLGLRYRLVLSLILPCFFRSTTSMDVSVSCWNTQFCPGLNHLANGLSLC